VQQAGGRGAEGKRQKVKGKREEGRAALLLPSTFSFFLLPFTFPQAPADSS
jgi:hypothetical protein